MKTMLALLLAGSTAFAQDKKFDLGKHPWAKFKAGSSATFTMDIQANGQAINGTYSLTLKDVGKANVTTSIVIEMQGQQQESEEVEDLPTYVGEETLKIDGKEYKCEIWTSKSNRDGSESTSKYWVCESTKVPLKLEVKDGELTGAITAVKFGEKLKVGDKEFECAKFEGELPIQGALMKTSMWMNPEIPGMAVKMEMEGAMGTIMLELKEHTIAK